MYQAARLLELVNVYLIEEAVDIMLFTPVLGVLELLEGLLVVEAASAEEASGWSQLHEHDPQSSSAPQ